MTITFIASVTFKRRRAAKYPIFVAESRGSNRECLFILALAMVGRGIRDLRRETMGSPALGQGSNCKLFMVSAAILVLN
jgi:hypothetical protein